VTPLTRESIISVRFGQLLALALFSWFMGLLGGMSLERLRVLLWR